MIGIRNEFRAKRRNEMNERSKKKIEGLLAILMQRE